MKFILFFSSPFQFVLFINSLFYRECLFNAFTCIFLVFSGITSPANAKLGHRMTTLHEEQLPLARKHSLDLIADDSNEDEKDDSTITHDGKIDSSVIFTLLF